jgi:hypothetical protein
MKGIANRNKKNPQSRGSIIIEFAFSIPTILIILYYVLDYPKYEQLKSKTRNSSYMAVSMIQNISKYRANKRITAKDLRAILFASFLNYYQGKQGICTDSSFKYALGHTPYLFVTLVKGLAESKVKVMWHLYAMSNSATVANTYFEIGTSRTSGGMKLMGLGNITYTCLGEYPASSIHPDLQIEVGEYKIILAVFFASQTRFKYGDDTSVTNDNAKRLFGFYMLPFKPLQLQGSGEYTIGYIFPSVAIFTPNPGLFSETPP